MIPGDDHSGVHQGRPRGSHPFWGWTVRLLILAVVLVNWAGLASAQLLDGPVAPRLSGESHVGDHGPATLTGAWQQVPDELDAIGGYDDSGQYLPSTSTSVQYRSPSTQTLDPPFSFNSLGAVADGVVVEEHCSTCGGPAYTACPNCARFPFTRFLGGHGKGMGQPLTRESWRYRPFSAGWLMGLTVGAPLIDDWVGLREGFVGGYRLGWDYHNHWGCEMQFGFASVGLYDSDHAIQAQQAADALLGLDPSDPFLTRFDQRRDADVFTWDVHFLHYPWGDAAWRPYWSIGLGSMHVRFMDRLSERRSKALLAVPIALGMKYRCNDWLALRVELSDNIAFGGGPGFNTLNNLMVTGGMEVRFGGTRKVYWPYSPGRHYW